MGLFSGVGELIFHGAEHVCEKDVTKVAEDMPLHSKVMKKLPSKTTVAVGGVTAAAAGDEIYHKVKDGHFVGAATVVGDGFRVLTGGLPWWAYPTAGVVVGGVVLRSPVLAMGLGGAGLAYGYSRS